MSDASEVRKLLRQQAAIARFGSFALRQSDLQPVLEEAARVCADGLNVPFCKVCCYQPEKNELLIVAGFGWKAGVVGHVVSRADESSPQGRAFITGEPSICNDLRNDTRFQLPAFYSEHQIISTIDVLIKGTDRPYGVLEVDSNVQVDYGVNDINFLTGFANVLAEAVATSSRMELLRTTIDQMRALVGDKDRLLAQKKVLAEELQHRVQNNLQLIYGMLSRQLDETTDAAGQKGLRAITRRVSTLAQVYDHLLGSELSRTTDFGNYVRSLCRSIAEVQGDTGSISLSCVSDVMDLDLDVVTALGIVVTELVTNSYDHAFPDGKGVIAVEVHKNDNSAVLTIRDSGPGFTINPQSKRQGLGLVSRLILQIQGTIDHSNESGSCWTITFPVPDIMAV